MRDAEVEGGHAGDEVARGSQAHEGRRVTVEPGTLIFLSGNNGWLPAFAIAIRPWPNANVDLSAYLVFDTDGDFWPMSMSVDEKKVLVLVP